MAAKKFQETRHLWREATRLLRTVAVAILALALLATACGSAASNTEEIAGVAEDQLENAAVAANAEDPTPGVEDPPAEPTAEPTEVVPTEVADSAEANDGSLTTDDEAAPPAPTRLELSEADWSGLTEWTLGALGGLTFGVPAGHVVHHDADMVTIRDSFDFDRGRYEPSMIIALTAQTGSGDAVFSIEDFTNSAIAGVGTAEPTYELLSLFDQELEGWRFNMDDNQPVGPHYLYSAYPAGAGGPTAWQPFPLAELFLAEVPEGVLVVGLTAQSAEDLVTARAIFDRVAPTLELARSLEDPLPTVLPIRTGPPEPPPEPVTKPEGWPALLTGLSKPLDSGDYTITALSTAMSVTLDDGWWVQPNFPTWFILSGDESFGLGDRGLAFRTGVNSLVPSDRSGAVGDAIPFDFAALAAAPPKNIEISSSEDVTIGGASGTLLRLQIAESAGCGAGDPCEYVITTQYPFPDESIRKGFTYDLWYLEGGLNEPILIVAMSPDDSWMTLAQEVVDTLVFDVIE